MSLGINAAARSNEKEFFFTKKTLKKLQNESRQKRLERLNLIFKELAKEACPVDLSPRTRRILVPYIEENPNRYSEKILKNWQRSGGFDFLFNLDQQYPQESLEIDMTPPPMTCQVDNSQKITGKISHENTNIICEMGEIVKIAMFALTLNEYYRNVFAEEIKKSKSKKKVIYELNHEDFPKEVIQALKDHLYKSCRQSYKDLSTFHALCLWDLTCINNTTELRELIKTRLINTARKITLKEDLSQFLQMLKNHTQIHRVTGEEKQNLHFTLKTYAIKSYLNHRGIVPWQEKDERQFLLPLKGILMLNSKSCVGELTREFTKGIKISLHRDERTRIAFAIGLLSPSFLKHIKHIELFMHRDIEKDTTAIKFIMQCQRIKTVTWKFSQASHLFDCLNLAIDFKEGVIGADHIHSDPEKKEQEKKSSRMRRKSLVVENQKRISKEKKISSSSKKEKKKRSLSMSEKQLSQLKSKEKGKEKAETYKKPIKKGSKKNKTNRSLTLPRSKQNQIDARKKQYLIKERLAKIRVRVKCQGTGLKIFSINPERLKKIVQIPRKIYFDSSCSTNRIHLDESLKIDQVLEILNKGRFFTHHFDLTKNGDCIDLKRNWINRT